MVEELVAAQTIELTATLALALMVVTMPVSVEAGMRMGPQAVSTTKEAVLAETATATAQTSASAEVRAAAAGIDAVRSWLR